MRKLAQILLLAVATSMVAGLIFSPSSSATQLKIDALGDSFTSGYGADSEKWGIPDYSVYDNTTRIKDVNECHCSTTSYPQVIANSLGADLNSAACAGAQTDHILNTYQRVSPPQIEQLRPDTDIVMLTAGGNPNFMPLFECTVSDIKKCRPSSTAYQNAITDYTNEQLGVRLDQTYQAIKQKAPNAQKYIAVGYLPFMPRHSWEIGTCAAYISNIPYPGEATELKLLNTAIDSVNRVIKSAAERNGFTFVDLAGLVTAHNSACGTPGRALAHAIRTDFLTNEGGYNYSFHPTISGHRAMATAIINQAGL